MIKSALTRAWVPALAGAALAAGTLAAVPAVAAPPVPVGSAAPAPTAVAPRPADTIAHDPTIVKEGDWYYMVITGDAGRADTYLPVKRSRDLVNWTELDPVFSTLPSWVLPILGSAVNRPITDLWAPDLSYSHGEWRLYYAVSAAFGQNHSVIGLATTKTLDPSSPDFGWTDRGLVLQSKPAPGDPQEHNAIDPDVVTDAEGRTWLTWGSFWTGLKMRRLDAATGMLSTEDTTTYDLVNRQFPPNAVEGPSILRHGDYYYLFASFDFCCRGVDSDYRVIVGRSKEITGPYVDREGVSLLAGGGTELLRGYNEFAGTGHGDTFTDGGTTYFANHYYDTTDGGTPRLNVRPITWEDGWPSLGDPINPSRSAGHGSAYVQILPRGGSTVVENDGCGFEGANIDLAADSGSTCQQWQVDDRGEGSRILNRYSNKVAEVAACDNVDGGNVAQWGWVGFLPNNDCQRWDFETAGEGWTSIHSVLPGERAWTVDGANVEISTPAGTAAQQFRFQPVGDVLLGSTTDLQGVLAAAGCTDGGKGHTKVGFEQSADRNCQEWRFDVVPGTATYTVTNTANGLQLSTKAHNRGHDRGAEIVLAKPQKVALAARSWTLTPTDEGTWTLGNGSTTQEVRLLLP
ncbi:ricin-type beta-trefoil lectin protein [Kineococcus xinjiangensis]|uniref:Ricin-type beta-trefoil lectin protein n=1 Tax=Kineococcus xinjiangensis TaxID=512762 RepID=A0A2S6IUE7_9ACTN|nr:family 43 glycosylhydrolase [Kineococcus xinjiangensis]PPK97895.1 ricin-type beta-trefoil lectin protein [Kineococcus xinjiangensis]